MWWDQTAALPGAGSARGNLSQAAAGHRDRIDLPNTLTDAPQAQNARRGHPSGFPTTPDGPATVGFRGTGSFFGVRP